MDTLVEPSNTIAFCMWLLLLFLMSTEVPAVPLLMESDAYEEDSMLAIVESVEGKFNEV